MKPTKIYISYEIVSYLFGMEFCELAKDLMHIKLSCFLVSGMILFVVMI